MASVPRNVSDWLVTPAPLNTERHGERAIFSRDNSILERRRPGDYPGDCVCYSSHRLPLGQVWQITLLNTTSGWPFGLVSGCVLFSSCNVYIARASISPHFDSFIIIMSYYTSHLMYIHVLVVINCI